MNRRRRRFVPGLRAAAVLLAPALALTTGSCAIQRHGPDQAVYCALGKSRDGFEIYCPKPVLNGGWPAPFAFDRPGISVENVIGFPEDDFRLWPFVANLAFYELILLGLWTATRSLRIRRGKRANAATP